MFQADLTNCDREPIRIPGRIQSHGFIIVIDTRGIITHHSENITQYLAALNKNLLGEHSEILDPYIEKSIPGGFFNQLVELSKQPKGFFPNNPFNVTINGSHWNLIISQSGDCFLLDFEPEISDLDSELQQHVGRSLSEMLVDKQLKLLLDNAATQIRDIIHYDRVMVYKFHEDDHGEVVAEAKSNELEPWLGLHYPASDIPKQARDLYKVNLVRLIADVHSEPSAIISNQSEPLDLTNSGLRAVSPIHIQYLKNMDVASSFSVSIVDQDNLWGLIACHNYTPRFINYRQRESAKLVGQVLSSAVSFRQQEEDQHAQQELKDAVSTLTRSLLGGAAVHDALFNQAVTILDAADASGAVFYFENRLHTIGTVPDEKFLLELNRWLSEKVEDDCFFTNCLIKDFPEAKPYKAIASGLLACRLSKELNEFMIWFKPEVLSIVKWAGDPNKPAELINGILTISPRQSFETWSQEISNCSTPWRTVDISACKQLRDEVNYAISRKATELRVLNEKLREAYAELDTFSYTISHDLKNPLTTVKSFAQLISREAIDNSKIKSMAERIQGGASKMQYMIEEVLNYSRVGQSKINLKTIDMQRLLTDLKHDLLIASGNPNLNIIIESTPDIQGDELMIFQVFSNLVGNAVKYSGRSDNPAVVVKGQESLHEVTYSVSDNGIGIDPADHDKIFDLFSRAESGNGFEGSGVGLAIVKKILNKHQAKIWLESKPGEGSKFYVQFQRYNTVPLFN